ncbi:hypothetical protein L916_12944 [Phytophthora nicotianae]|uniref:Uncharacterized protein n=1 Tax=Phytophthora nicotianae TaxID=4792 RepID=W2IMW8_PHYNI|nr:hypothetical protein L916_12944 [Phytophthora nicotianae]
MQQYYMASTWGNWFYTAAVPGLTPSQNAIESHYKLIKKPTSICVVQVLELIEWQATARYRGVQGTTVLFVPVSQAMLLQGDISVDGMLRALPVRKPSGGQR